MPNTKASNSLVTIVLDVSPLAWGEHDRKRQENDKARTAAGKRSIGPAKLEEVLDSIQSFAVAVNSVERSAGLLVLAVADNESAVVYPRKDQLAAWLEATDAYTPDMRRIQVDLTVGVYELIERAAVKATVNQDPANRQAAMAAAFSKALCVINRFLVAAKAGVSALHTTHYLERVDDEGVIALGAGKSKKKKQAASAWSPRILLLQASDDRSRDYNAFMNCAFSASKLGVTVDGCFLTATGGNKTSPFLEQACDLTGGVFLAPSGAAQVGGALTEVLFAVFLAPVHCRQALNLPALHKVDFRARCFETSETVDMAFVCNQCLSIFKSKPTSTHCPTCQALIVSGRRPLA